MFECGLLGESEHLYLLVESFVYQLERDGGLGITISMCSLIGGARDCNKMILLLILFGVVEASMFSFAFDGFPLRSTMNCWPDGCSKIVAVFRILVWLMQTTVIGTHDERVRLEMSTCYFLPEPSFSIFNVPFLSSSWCCFSLISWSVISKWARKAFTMDIWSFSICENL